MHTNSQDYGGISSQDLPHYSGTIPVAAILDTRSSDQFVQGSTCHHTAARKLVHCDSDVVKCVHAGPLPTR